MQLKPRYQAQHYRGSGKLDGMSVLITGGDSGIGCAVAVLCAREGADVAIAYLSEHEDARETCALIEAEGGRSLALAGDVKDADFCSEAVGKVVKTFGKLNVLINNAAFQEHAASLDELTEERFDETFRTNIYGYFHMAKAALPYLQRGDSIINTGSVTGLRGSKELLDYSATKGAIHVFTKALAHNLADGGIRVNAVAPGPVWTPLNPADRPAKEVEKFGASTHLGRPAQPEEISPATCSWRRLVAPATSRVSCCPSPATRATGPESGERGPRQSRSLAYEPRSISTISTLSCTSTPCGRGVRSRSTAAMRSDSSFFASGVRPASKRNWACTKARLAGAMPISKLSATMKRVFRSASSCTWGWAHKAALRAVSVSASG